MQHGLWQPTTVQTSSHFYGSALSDGQKVGRANDIPPEAAELGRCMVTSIASAKSWLFDDGRRLRRAALCIDDPCPKQSDAPPARKTVRLDVSNGGWFYPGVVPSRIILRRPYH